MTRLPLLLVLFAALATASVAEANIRSIGSVGTAPGQFGDPTSVAVAGDGDLLVGEEANVRVQKLSPTGAPLLSFGSYGTEPGQFGGSESRARLWVAGGPDGSIYAADPGTGKVSRFDGAGNFVSRWEVVEDWSGSSTLSRPQAIDVDEAGDVYVAMVSRVIRYSADGAFEHAWTATDAQGRAVEVRDLGVRGGRVYVLGAYDWTFANMAVYDTGGALLERWTTPSATELSSFHRLAAGPAGDVFLVSWSRIDRYDAHGKRLGTLADPPEDFGSFAQCTVRSRRSEMRGLVDIAAAPDGTIYAADGSNDRVLRIERGPDVRLAVGPYGWAGQTTGWTGQYIPLDAAATTTPWGEAPNRYEWDLDGDGTFEHDTGAVPTTTTAYATTGPHLVRVRATEPGGTSAVESASFALQESVAHMTPQRFATGRVSRVFAYAEMPCSTVLKYEWDLNDDGSFETDTGTRHYADKVFSETGKQRVSVRVTRPGGRIDVASAVHTIDIGPPEGPVGVSINDGARFTNSPEVTVNPIWNPPTTELWLSNDGGFRPSTRFGVAAAIRWRLHASGPERLPKTVYLRYDSLNTGATYQDDIILDETDPVVTSVTAVSGASASASARRPRAHRIRIRARDNLSGVARMQVAGSRKRPGPWRKFARRTSVVTRSGNVWVRVRDRAGNRSRWRQAGG